MKGLFIPEITAEMFRNGCLESIEALMAEGEIYDIEYDPKRKTERKTDEWCTDCKEYDQEKHCCPRWNRVIRQTLSEQPEMVRCKDCKYWLHERQCIELSEFGTIETLPNEFCSRAERRTEND